MGEMVLIARLRVQQRGQEESRNPASEPCPYLMPRADGDRLKAAQQAGGAERKVLETPHGSKRRLDTQNLLGRAPVPYRPSFAGALGEKNKGTGCGRVGQSEVCRVWSVLCEKEGASHENRQVFARRPMPTCGRNTALRTISSTLICIMFTKVFSQGPTLCPGREKHWYYYCA